MLRRSLLSLLVAAGCFSAMADSQSDLLSSARNILSKVGLGEPAAPADAAPKQEAPKPAPQFESSPEPQVQAARVPLQVCASQTELGKAIRNALAPYSFPEMVVNGFAQGNPCAVIGEENGQQYLYFLGRIDNIDKIPAAELDTAVNYHVFSALLPQGSRRVTFYQRGSRMLMQSRCENEGRRISWYLNNEKKYTVTAARGNHYSWNSVSTDALDKLDSFSFECFDANKTENLAVFLLKGDGKSFLFLGRTPVSKSFASANNFLVLR